MRFWRVKRVGQCFVRFRQPFLRVYPLRLRIVIGLLSFVPGNQKNTCEKGINNTPYGKLYAYSASAHLGISRDSALFCFYDVYENGYVQRR